MKVDSDYLRCMEIYANSVLPPLQLTDYSTALARASESDPSVTTAELCNDVNIAAKYEFSGRSFTKSVLYGKSNDGWMLNLDTPYDVNSRYLLVKSLCESFADLVHRI